MPRSETAPTPTHAVGPETERIELPGGFYVESTGHIHQMGPSFDAWDVFDSGGGYCGELVDKAAVDAFAAAIHARPDGVAPGHKIVPLEPTAEMLRAGGGMIPGTAVDETSARAVWCFMLDAVPKAPAPAPQGDGYKAGLSRARDVADRQSFAATLGGHGYATGYRDGVDYAQGRIVGAIDAEIGHDASKIKGGE